MSTNICRNFIDGELRDSRSSDFIDVTNPATGGVLARLPLSTLTDVDDAVASSQTAFKTWSERCEPEGGKVTEGNLRFPSVGELGDLCAAKILDRAFAGWSRMTGK